MNFVPPYPRPHKTKSSFILRFFRGWHSWMHVLFERSYTMKMGHFRQPGLDFFMINEPKWVRHILSDRADEYPKHRMMHRLLKPVLGNSVFTTNGEVWKRQRRLVDQAFEQARLKLVFPLMQAATRDLLGRLRTMADGQSRKIDEEMSFVAADIIFRTILSETLDESDAMEVYRAFIRFQHHAQRNMTLMFYRLPSFFAWRACERDGRIIRTLLAKVIERRIAAMAAAPDDTPSDILDALLRARDPETGEGLSPTDTLDQLCIIFIAGHETSASALAWSLYLLAHAPEYQEAMRAELQAVVGDRPLEFSDIKKLGATWNLFREALRLYPPVGVFVREATSTHCIRDKVVPEGSPLLISPWLIQRHRKLWERPDEFDPCRFDTASGQASMKEAYLPFSMGPRVCLGAAFAMQEAVLILVSIVRDFVILPDPNHEPKPVGRVTIRSENGVKVIFKSRIAG